MRSAKRRDKIPTERYLENVALSYLGRYAASEASLKRVLENRLRRAAMRNAEFAADQATQKKLRAAIERIVAAHKKSGALNDAAFAETKTVAMRRAGRSARVIAMTLTQKGVAKSAIEKALRGDEDFDAQAAELKAALAFARKKRLGKFRKDPADFDRQRKEFAAMARAGFASAIVRQVLNSTLEMEEEF